jgi:hypothetical protein
MNAEAPDRHVLRPTLADWNGFCMEKGIGAMKPCPMCGAAGQAGADESQAALSMGPAATADFLREQTMTQECENCGYQMTYGMGPFVDWLLKR